LGKNTGWATFWPIKKPHLVTLFVAYIRLRLEQHFSTSKNVALVDGMAQWYSRPPQDKKIVGSNRIQGVCKVSGCIHISHCVTHVENITIVLKK
jgi:hypothetical protein